MLTYLQNTAIANGTYYNGICPPQGTAGIVFVHNASCSYSSSTNWDSATSPGMLIFDTGTVSFSGGESIYAVVYMENLNGTTNGGCTQTNVQTSNPLFSIQGTSVLYGGVFVDNCGTVYAGDSAGNIQFWKNSFGGAMALGTPSLVKDTFRVYSG
jgi:hypothetical protein